MTERLTESSTADGELIGDEGHSSKTLSMMGGIARPEGLPEVEQIGLEPGKAARRKMLTQGTMLILVVFVIAAGTLYGMRLSQSPVGPSAHTKSVEAKIDQALAKLATPGQMAGDDPLTPGNIQQLFGDTEDIVSVFSTDMTTRQVPARFVKKNPFVLPVFQPIATPEIGPAVPDGQAKKDHLMMLQREAGRLELQSIMQGSRPVAIISGKLVQPGQSIGPFTVKVVHNLSVDLEAMERFLR